MMPKKWRNKPTRMMITRTLEKKEIPNLIEAMAEDGVSAYITSSGIAWYHAEYKVAKNVIGDVWGLSSTQMDRVNDYIYGNDPFVNIYKHEYEKVD
tara:strand:+ start:592 stop:879 length:288 start_codon:yes stop_codon:yes gene_type:complete